jgi:hypothetical protein
MNEITEHATSTENYKLVSLGLSFISRKEPAGKVNDS